MAGMTKLILGRMKTVKLIAAVMSLLFFTLTLALINIPVPAKAANPINVTAAYADLGIPNSNAFKLNSDAVVEGNYIRLTRNLQSKWGSAFRMDKIVMPANFAFNAYFTFQIISPGADGMVFVIQGSTNTAGGLGGDLGFTGINPGFGIEFDTFRNFEYGDPNNNHIAIVANGSANHNGMPSPVPVSITNFGNGNVHHVWIEYTGTTVKVRLGNSNDRSNATEVLSQDFNIAALFGGNTDMYFGFTASTGYYSEEHRILSVYFNNDDIGGIDTSQNTYISAPATITLTASPTSIRANGITASTISAIPRDVNGVAMSVQPIQFTTDLGTVSPTSAITDSNGIATTFLTGISPGTAIVRGTGVGGVYGETTVSLLPYTITATAGSNGSISPSGSVKVNYKASQTFTFTPEADYRVDTLTVDGLLLRPATSYTFSNVTADHTIAVTFGIVGEGLPPSSRFDPYGGYWYSAYVVDLNPKNKSFSCYTGRIQDFDKDPFADRNTHLIQTDDKTVFFRINKQGKEVDASFEDLKLNELIWLGGVQSQAGDIVLEIQLSGFSQPETNENQNSPLGSLLDRFWAWLSNLFASLLR